MESNLYPSLGQVSSEDAGQIFREHLRGCVRQMISEVMAAEVSELCDRVRRNAESRSDGMKTAAVGDFLGHSVVPSFHDSQRDWCNDSMDSRPWLMYAVALRLKQHAVALRRCSTR